MEFKTLTQWANDPRCPLSKISLWRAVDSGHLKACRPTGSYWMVSYDDLISFLGGNVERG